jgi:HPt (histidine-containing phosphotransfer) domain-containing protein
MREEGPIVSEYANDPDMIELVEGFVARIAARRTAFWGAYESRNAVDLKRLAHQLKGAAGGFGFPILTQFAAALEAAIVSNYAAGVEVGKLGAATVTPEEVLDAFDAHVADG